MKIKILLRYNIIALSLAFFLWSCNSTNQEKTDDVQPEIVNDSLSIARLTKQITDGDKNPELFVQRAKLYANKGNFDKGISDIELAISVDSVNLSYYLLLAEYQLSKGQSGKSLESLQKCIEIDPNNIPAILNLAEINLYVAQYEESMDYVLMAQKIDQNNAHAYFLKSLIYKETGDTTRAIKSLFSTIEVNPEYYDAYMLLGSLHALHNDSLALQFFRNAIKIIPNSIEAYYNIAMFYQNHNDFEKALLSYDDLLAKTDSLYIYAFFNKAYIHLHYTSNLDLAISYFSKVIDLKNNYFQAYHNRGLAYETKGDFELARQDYQKAIQILPNYQLSIEGLNRLDKKQNK